MITLPQFFALEKGEVVLSLCFEQLESFVLCWWLPIASCLLGGYPLSGTLQIMVRVSGNTKGLLKAEPPTKTRPSSSGKSIKSAILTPLGPPDVTVQRLSSDPAPLKRLARLRSQLGGKTAVERSAKRQKFIQEAPQLPRFPGQTFLEQMAVSHEVALDYMTRMRFFHVFAQQKRLKLHPSTKLDESFSIYLNQLFSDGADASEGFKTFAALLDAYPQTSGKAGLPRARRCLQGWAKLDPARSRPPMPFSLVALICCHLLELQCVEAALAILLSFTAYLRPSEVLNLRGSDLVGPTRNHPHLALNLHPEERMETSKMGLANESILLDSTELPFLNSALKKLSTHRKNQYLFDQSAHGHRSPSRSLCTIPAQAQRAFARSPAQPADSTGCKDERPMEQRFISSTVRVPCSSTSTIPAVASPDSSAVPCSTSSTGKAGPKMFHPKMNPFSKVWWIVEFFSGCANLSKTCAAAGFHAIAYDILYGPGNDLLCKQTLAAAIKFIKSHAIALVWLGTPCTSWSRARKNDGGPPPLRDDSAGLMGLPSLRSHDQQKVELGNALLEVSLSIITVCTNVGIRWVLENP